MDGSVTWYKARLVAHGFSQKFGCDCDETFISVVRAESMRALLALATQEDMHLHQMDIQTAFLNGELQEEVYMGQPVGYEVEEKEHQVCKLHKSIYSLKQSPRCWNHVLDKYLKELELHQISSDPCLYVSITDSTLIVALYVDDLALVGKCFKMIEEMKQSLSDRFKMQDLGQLHHFLGIKVLQNLVEGKMWIEEPNYVQKILERFGMQDSKPMSTPSAPDSKLIKKTADDEEADQKKYQAAVGSLLYLSTKTRPDIAFAVGNVARFVPSQPKFTSRQSNES